MRRQLRLGWLFSLMLVVFIAACHDNGLAISPEGEGFEAHAVRKVRREGDTDDRNIPDDTPGVEQAWNTLVKRRLASPSPTPSPTPVPTPTPTPTPVPTPTPTPVPTPTPTPVPTPTPTPVPTPTPTPVPTPTPTPVPTPTPTPVPTPTPTPVPTPTPTPVPTPTPTPVPTPTPPIWPHPIKKFEGLYYNGIGDDGYLQYAQFKAAYDSTAPMAASSFALYTEAGNTYPVQIDVHGDGVPDATLPAGSGDFYINFFPQCTEMELAEEGKWWLLYNGTKLIDPTEAWGKLKNFSNCGGMSGIKIEDFHFKSPENVDGDELALFAMHFHNEAPVAMSAFTVRSETGLVLPAAWMYDEKVGNYTTTAPAGDGRGLYLWFKPPACGTYNLEEYGVWSLYINGEKATDFTEAYGKIWFGACP